MSKLTYVHTQIVPGDFEKIDDLDSILAPVSTQNSQSFKLYTPVELSNEIALYRKQHLRPMSDYEYNQYLQMIKEKKTLSGKQLFNHDVAAIARVVKENYDNFFPGATLDPAITNMISYHTEIDELLKDRYYDSLQRYRDAFVSQKATDVPDLYTNEEKTRLKSLGIVDIPLSNEKMTTTSMPGSSDRVLKQTQNAHPMLRYNLLK